MPLETIAAAPPGLRPFADRADFAAAAAAFLAAHLRDAIAARGRAGLGLSGGSTPAPIYESLSAQELDWARVEAIVIDDRQVPSEHRASNFGMITRALCRGAAAALRVTPLGLDAPSCAAIAQFPWPLDVALFGMGLDGHTASWFPGGAGLGAVLDRANPALVGETVPDPLPEDAPFARLSLTRAALASTRAGLLAITSEAKRARFVEVFAGDYSSPAAIAAAPVRALAADLGARLTVFWAP